MKKIRISSDALSDLNEGYLFYEQQGRGLGDYFSASLRSDIEELKLSGGSHRIVYLQFYRSLSRIFPYGIFYTSQDELITVYAVVDLRRDPDFIRRHLEQTNTQQDD
ncbi:MAG: type II toxin-antitoxin system RelE/ParE family toxin [Puniceicoccaceae bacterium]|nr:MAG: type II toxin-antitoxin system RelE/ParE family toxin [Puniceicoccaceae bacterium]